ncbi:MAG: hypothetical protein HOK20_01220 [Alphaproteobacteria bacterium]|nr:hypothetical protein [Alphaproteobacteria bacterium]
MKGEVSASDIKRENSKIVFHKKKFGKEFYYLASLMKKRPVPGSEVLFSKLSGGQHNKSEHETYCASMLCFSSPGASNLVFLFGEWGSLLNKDSVVPEWGLRFATSSEICRPDKIKEIRSKSYRDGNPAKYEETKSKPTQFEGFTLDVGSESLFELRMYPRFGGSHLVRAEDYFKFSFSGPVSPDEDATLSSLKKMNDYILGVCSRGLSLEPRMKAHIDEEVRANDLIRDLNKVLEVLLSNGKAVSLVFPTDYIWRTYGIRNNFLLSGREHKKFPIFSGKSKVSLQSDLTITPIRRGSATEAIGNVEKLSRAILTLPIEHHGKFYRFNGGRWFEVDASRFSAIIGVLRGAKHSADSMYLPPYTKDHAQKKDGDKGYAELRYNRAAVQHMKEQNLKAFLLDRVNVSFGGVGNTFEFADVALIDEAGVYNLIHVKRAAASDISHHREQVERCAEYLGTELKKGNAKDLFLRASINGLYLKSGININKTKNQGKRLTHGDTFHKKFKNSKPRKKENHDKYVKRLIKEVQKKYEDDLKRAKKNKEKIQASINFLSFLQSADLSFFYESYSSSLPVILDALFDCHETFKDNKKVAEEFLTDMQNTVGINAELLLDGIAPEELRNKVNIILAIVDDRAFKKKEDESETKTPLIKKQQLWGLDRTRQLVQKHGFGFKIVVVNENTEDDCDAFGKVANETEAKSISERHKTASTDGEAESDQEMDFDEESSEEEDGGKSNEHTVGELSDSDKELLKYEYKSTDMNNAVKASIDFPRAASLEGVDEVPVSDVYTGYRYEYRLLLPALGAELGSAIKTVTDVIKNLDEEVLNEIQEILIPFNPGGHWTTIQIVISEEKTIVNYIESLMHDYSDEKAVCVQHIKNDLFIPLRYFLEGMFRKDVECSIKTFRMQTDEKACGPIVVENILDLFEGKEPPVQIFDKDLTLGLRHSQEATLSQGSMQLDL